MFTHDVVEATGYLSNRPSTAQCFLKREGFPQVTWSAYGQSVHHVTTDTRFKWVLGSWLKCTFFELCFSCLNAVSLHTVRWVRRLTAWKRSAASWSWRPWWNVSRWSTRAWAVRCPPPFPPACLPASGSAWAWRRPARWDPLNYHQKNIHLYFLWFHFISLSMQARQFRKTFRTRLVTELEAVTVVEKCTVVVLKYFVICPLMALNCCLPGHWLQRRYRIPDLFVQQWKWDPLPAHVLGGEVTERTCRGLRSTSRYVVQVIRTVSVSSSGRNTEGDGISPKRRPI